MARSKRVKKHRMQPPEGFRGLPAETPSPGKFRRNESRVELGVIPIVVLNRRREGRQIRPLGYSSIRRTFSLGVRNFEGRRAAQLGNQKWADTKSQIQGSRETRP